jgi:hypothetical protein
MKPKIILLTLALVAGTAPVIRADLLDNLTVDIRLGRRAPPPPPAVVVVVSDDDHRGPDQWEHRSRWDQRSQAYYYYPGGDVYYRSSDHVWFYLERGQWRSGRNLPDSIRIDFNRSVTLTMFTDQPYAFHQQVVARYPSDYFVTRVRIRDDERHDDRHEDNRGKGRDKDRHGEEKDRENKR